MKKRSSIFKSYFAHLFALKKSNFPLTLFFLKFYREKSTLTVPKRLDLKKCKGALKICQSK